jgi:hypothetical protein
MRSLALIAFSLMLATFAAAQTPDAGNERTTQGAGTSGAARSHTLTPGGPAEPHEITTTSTDTVPLSDDQRNKLKAYFAQGGRNVRNDEHFTISVGAAVPKQIPLQPLASDLGSILPVYKGDQYVMVRQTLVIATPDRRIVAIIPVANG